METCCGFGTDRPDLIIIIVNIIEYNIISWIVVHFISDFDDGFVGQIPGNA